MSVSPKKKTFSQLLEQDLSTLSLKAQETIYKVFSTAVRILKCKQARRQLAYDESVKKGKKKPRSIELKRSDVSSALVLTDFHFSHSKEVFATANMGLHHVTEDDAVRFYEKFVMGQSRDKFGREIKIDEDGIVFLYKEAKTDKHIVSSENYVESRGKRLHWIRPTIEQTEEIYEIHEQNWTSYYYVGTFIVPYTDEMTGEKVTRENYLFVVVRKEPDKSLKFVTAYPIETYEQFLKRIEPAHLYVHPGH